MKNLLKAFWAPSLAAFIFGIFLIIVTQKAKETGEIPLKPITREWLLLSTEVKGEEIQIRFLKEDFPDFIKFLNSLNETGTGLVLIDTSDWGKR